jgi:hypothetical protein
MIDKKPSIWEGGGEKCDHDGCTRDAVGFEPRFSYYYCDIHQNIPPNQWKFKAAKRGDV